MTIKVFITERCPHFRSGGKVMRSKCILSTAEIIALLLDIHKRWYMSFRPHYASGIYILYDFEAMASFPIINHVLHIILAYSDSITTNRYVCIFKAATTTKGGFFK
jgi:hypothetical protein